MNDDCYCYYDGESPVFYTKELRTRSARATKTLKCYECHRPILAGDHYERVWAKYPGDDAPKAIGTCPRCLAVRDYVEAHVPCFCWLHGDMLEDARETIRGYFHEAPGLKFGFLRLLSAVCQRKPRVKTS